MDRQVTSRPEEHQEAAEACQRLRNEWVVQVQGRLVRRSDPNPELPTGQVELVPSRVSVLNTAPAKLPLLPSDPAPPKEETRLRNRVLDLRSELSQLGLDCLCSLSVTGSGGLKLGCSAEMCTARVHGNTTS